MFYAINWIIIFFTYSLLFHCCVMPSIDLRQNKNVVILNSKNCQSFKWKKETKRILKSDKKRFFCFCFGINQRTSLKCRHTFCDRSFQKNINFQFSNFRNFHLRLNLKKSGSHTPTHWVYFRFIFCIKSNMKISDTLNIFKPNVWKEYLWFCLKSQICIFCIEEINL